MKLDTKFLLITLAIIVICCIMFIIKNKTIERFFVEKCNDCSNTTGTVKCSDSGMMPAAAAQTVDGTCTSKLTSDLKYCNDCSTVLKTETCPSGKTDASSRQLVNGVCTLPNNLADINIADATLNDLLHSVTNVSAVSPQTVTAPELNNVKNDLENKLKDLDSLLTSINSNVKLALNQDKLNDTSSVEGAMDEQTIQLLQDKEIERLTDRLNKLKTAYNTYLNTQQADGQPKIPIYSSCIVSEASGTYTTDNINRNNIPSTTTRRDNSRPVPTSVSNNNPFKDANITDSEINFDDILNQLSQLNKSSKINVNVGV
jgi:hypothetical protein